MNQQQKAMGLMALCASMWSIGGIFIKLVSWNPLLIGAGRGVFTMLIVGLFMVKTGKKLIINKYSIISAIAVSGCCTCFVIANKLTTAANAIVLQYTCPVFILIISALFLKKKLKNSEIITVTITTLGIALFFFDQLSPTGILGNMVAIISGIFMATMFIAIGMAKDDDAVRISGIFLSQIVIIAIGIAALPFYGFSTTGIEILYVIILGVVQLGIPYLLFWKASKDCSPLACSLLGMLEPLLNPVWVFFFAGEAPGVFALIGGVIVIATISAWCIYQSRTDGGETES